MHLVPSFSFVDQLISFLFALVFMHAGGGSATAEALLVAGATAICLAS